MHVLTAPSVTASRGTVMRFVIMAFAVSVAFGQTDRMFQLTQDENKQELEEIATVLRATGDIQQVSIDDINRTVTVEGTAGQVAIADWLIRQMDLPANGPFSGVHEYRPVSGGDDIVRVFYLTHASTAPEVQEIATTVRSVADVPRVFIYNALNAVAVRGTNQQISLAAWLVDQLNQPANVSAPAPHEYKLPGDDVARVFELTYPQTPQQLQEIVTLIRSIGDISRLFLYTERRTVALRGTAEQSALAAWLVSELDKPVNGQTAAEDSTVPQEYRLSSGHWDDLVRVFYLPGFQSAQDRQRVATQVRATSGIMRLFIYNALGVLAARGTDTQVATAEKVIAEMKVQ